MIEALVSWQELGFGEDITPRWEEGPRKKSAELLDRALQLVRSVPYHVTLRWLFYGLWQEGYFSDQKPSKLESAKRLAYCNFSKLLSRLKHSPEEFQERWPIELADDRRDPIHFTDWNKSSQEWLNSVIKQLECNVDKMTGQDRYIMVAFEAEAMQSQFIHYTEPYGVSLWPFSGATSIPYKKRLAKHIEAMTGYFGLPVTVLYFGDYDTAGLAIPESAFRHVRKWCSVDFLAYRVGLNLEHIEKYSIQEDPEKPGKFQWEAVNDSAAREIITGALDSLLHLEVISEIKRQESEMTERAREALKGIKHDT